MKNDINYRVFRFGDLIEPKNAYKSYAYTKEFLELHNWNKKNTIPFVTRTENNNCVDSFAYNDELDYIEDGNAIIVGDTTATVSYQKEPFITGDHIVVIRANWINEYTGIYITTLLNKEKFRYSYGRAFLKETILNTKIKLPAKYEPNNDLADDDGYIPDWDYMEEYIKELKSKKVTTNNKKENVPCIDTNTWRVFSISKLFFVSAGTYHYSSEYSPGATPYISATNKDNGISEYIDLEPDFSGNVITTEKINCMAFYQKEPFCATSDVNILNPKFKLNEYIAMFIISVINFDENYRWNYGRQCRVSDTNTISIKLPAKYEPNNDLADDDGYIPDWDYMEDFIKKLPYGDKLKEAE